MRFNPEGLCGNIFPVTVASPVTASHDVLSAVWLEHGIWNMPPVLPLDNIAQLALYSMFSLIKGM